MPLYVNNMRASFSAKESSRKKCAPAFSAQVRGGGGAREMRRMIN
jgi:hypothetical protein